ncbi:transposase [Patescibacteria group bacterium]|nr:transposase [Patescibacteria group bacterium]
MLRKEKFVPNEYYHIYNRTIFNISQFKDTKSAERLAQAFLIANSTESTRAFQFLRNHQDATIEDALRIAKEGEKLVDILCYVIMPDHYHLLLKEIKENGISNFIHKCNISVAKYINIKNDRSGPLFESLFKSKHIATNEYLLHLSLYIHLNPLDFLVGKYWREHKIKNWNLSQKKLLNYPWSSLKAFLYKNYEDRIVSGTEIILNQFKDRKEYESFLQEWSEESISKINDIIIN